MYVDIDDTRRVHGKEEHEWDSVVYNPGVIFLPLRLELDNRLQADSIVHLTNVYHLKEFHEVADGPADTVLFNIN
jgi:hypothetical protein